MKYSITYCLFACYFAFSADKHGHVDMEFFCSSVLVPGNAGLWVLIGNCQQRLVVVGFLMS